MLKGVVSRRYAEAIFEIAVEQHTLDRWLADVHVVAEYFGDRRLAFVLSEPNIAPARKEQVVRDLLETKVQHDALGFALLLVERGLADIAPRVAGDFEQRYNEYNHQVVATITTAMPLDADMRESVTRDLARITGKRILLEEQVDPSILGGAIARVGDTLIDGSVRRKLSLLRQQIERGGGDFGGPQDGRAAPVEPLPDGGGEAGDGRAPFAVSPKDLGTDGAGDARP